MPDATRFDWEHEKARIKKLAWWDEVKDEVADFPKKEAYYFHPAGFVGNFLGGCITYSDFKFLFKSNHIYAEEFFVELSKYCMLFKLGSCLRRAHFIGQIAREVGGNFNVFENLNYKASVLKQKFSYFSNHPAEADTYGRTSSHSANPKAIANRAYGNRIGNGNIASGDGWKYRGIGGKQLTGKSNYQSFENWHNSSFPNDKQKFVDNPNLLGQSKYAARSAAFFWVKHKLYNIADKGIENKYINKITDIINFYDDANGKKERRSNVKNIHKKLCKGTN